MKKILVLVLLLLLSVGIGVSCDESSNHSESSYEEEMELNASKKPEDSSSSELDLHKQSPVSTTLGSKVDKSIIDAIPTVNDTERIRIDVWLKSAPASSYVGGTGSINIDGIVSSFNAKLQNYSKEHGPTTVTDLPIDVFRSFSGLTNEAIMSDYEVRACLESAGGLPYTIEIYYRNLDLYNYRQQVKASNNSISNRFYSLLDLDRCSVFYRDQMLCFFTLDCDADYIYVLQDLDCVSSLSLYEDKGANVEAKQENAG